MSDSDGSVAPGVPANLQLLMQVTYEESGGFAGLRRGCRLDSKALPANERVMLERLLARAAAIGSNQRAATKPQPPAPDATQYVVRINDDGAKKALSFSDATTDQAAWDLLAFLQERARPLRIDESP